MNRTARILILTASAAIFCYAGIGHVLGRTPDDKAYKSLTVYGEVLQKIQQDYVDEPNMRMVTVGSLHGLLESLDPQSGYLTPREYTEYKAKLASRSVGDTGLTVSKRYGYVIVISVLPDSPAEKAGIRSGDIFESIGGFTTRDMSIGQAENLLAGSVGTDVKVGVIRRGKTEPDEVSLLRTKLPPAKVVVQKIEPDILTLRLLSLEAGRADEIRAQLAAAAKQGVHKIVLDLRDCGRGTPAEAVAVAQLFIPSGNLATLRGQTISAQTFAADPSKVVWKGPVSVLIDPTTSGAAEILASAMVTNHRGDVVGERSFGLASEQKVITLADGAALILTVGNYYNGDGKSILSEGVTPTEVVQASAADDGSEDDSTAAPSQPAASAEPRPLSVDDPILKRALELLKAPAAKKAA